MKISKRDRRVLVWGAGFCLIVLLLFYGVLPFYDSRTEVELSVERKKQLLERSLKVIQSERIYRSQQVELESILEKYRTQLLEARDGTAARVQLEEIVRSLAEEHGVSISRSNPLQERKIGDRYARITLQINMQSGMQELTSFLHALSMHPKFLKVEEFQVNGFRSRNQVIRLQPRMNVTAFIQLS